MEHVVTKYMITTDVHSVEAIQASKELITIVDEGTVQDNLLRLVQALGEYLINDDEYVRAKATALLSNTLAECKQEEINESAVTVLVDFYCERLTDSTCVPSLLEGLVALTNYPNFTGKNAVTTAKRLIQNLQIQQYPQGTRITAFKIFESLIRGHAAALKSINDEFVYGFTKQLDGEKDPRNLMRAFHIVKELVEKLDISNHIEDVFEVTFCYFPITFKPPPGNPYGITADDLKVSLRSCMASTPLFAKFALPLVLEKLSSTAGSAKKDAMETLAACAPVYGPEVLLPHIEEIYTSLKVEVFHSIEASLEDAAVEAIQSITSALNLANTSTSQQSVDPAEKAVKCLIDECATNLKDPDMKDHQQSGRIIRAIASASDTACRLVVSIIIPQVLRQYRETNMAVLRKANVDIMLETLEACKTLYGTAAGDVDEAAVTDLSSPLIQYKERFIGIFESSLMASNEYNLLRLGGLNGLKLMILSKGFLESNEVGIAIQSINKILLEEPEEELRSAALEALSVTSKIDCKYIYGITIPSLVDRLPENTSTESNNRYYSRLLHALKVLAPVPSVYEQAMPLLIEKFDRVCKEDEKPSYAIDLIRTILDILKTKSKENHQDLLEGIDTIIPHFLQIAVESSITNEHNLILDPTVMDTIALIIITIVVKTDSDTQKSLLERAFTLFVEGQLPEFKINNATNIDFRPLVAASSKHLNEQQKSTCLLFAAIICSLRRDVALPVTTLEDFLNNLLDLLLESDNEVQFTSVARIIGSLVNKWRNNTALTNFVKTTALRLEDLITQQTSNQRNALVAYLWIAKALILRTHSIGYDLTNKIIQWCGDNTAGSQAPQGFAILIGDDPFALNKNMFATTTILYKQRFFEHCLSQLVDGYRTAGDDIKPNYLIALSYVLQNVPKQILLNELPPLVPLLLQSLSLTDSELKVSTLETLSLAVSEAADIVAPQIRVILPALLGLLENTTANSLGVRVAALKCLAQFPNYISKDTLGPHVNFVIGQLKTPLDDKKRIVRKEAVDCRFSWYNIAN